MSRTTRQQIDADYYGYCDEESDELPPAFPLGDLFDDDTYWKHDEDEDEEQV